MSEEIQHTVSEPGAFRLIYTLSAAGFLSGVVLVGIYLFTLPVIQNNKAEAQRQAIFKVLPGTVSFQTLALKDGKLAETAVSGDEVIFLGKDDKGQVTGFAVSGAEAGFQDIVGVIFGYHPGRQAIIGYEVLQCKETPGLGDKIFKDEAFVDNFRELAVIPEIVLVKSGAKQHANEVDAITGATISSKAVVKLLNKSLEKWKPHIERYVTENLGEQ